MDSSSKQLCCWLTITRLSPELSTGRLHNFELWIELFLEVLLPVVGIVVELVRWRLAKWVNVGYPLAAAFLWLGEAARWRHDPFFGVLLIMGAGMLTLTGLATSFTNEQPRIRQVAEASISLSRLVNLGPRTLPCSAELSPSLFF